MGLDGGTIATRTDILRGSSWRQQGPRGGPGGFLRWDRQQGRPALRREPFDARQVVPHLFVRQPGQVQDVVIRAQQAPRCGERRLETDRAPHGHHDALVHRADAGLPQPTAGSGGEEAGGGMEVADLTGKGNSTDTTTPRIRKARTTS